MSREIHILASYTILPLRQSLQEPPCLSENTPQMCNLSPLGLTIAAIFAKVLLFSLGVPCP